MMTTIVSVYRDNRQVCGDCGCDKLIKPFFEEIDYTIYYKATCQRCGTINVVAKREAGV